MLLLFQALLIAMVSAPCIVLAAGVTVLFDPSSPDVGPFPTDFLTVPDAAQKTGVRVNLPLPHCDSEPSSCQELQLINQLDGFNLQTRLRVRFSAPVDTDTLREGIFFIALDNLTDEEFGLQHTGQLTPMNQIVFDPATQIVYAKPDDFLDQHRRYAMVVTDAVRDRQGNAVAPDSRFLDCIGRAHNGYCGQLAELVNQQGPRFGPRHIIAASLFSTMSTTAWMEKARAQIQNSQLNLKGAGSKSIFALPDIALLLLRQQVRINPSEFSDLEVRFPAALLNGVGRIAFGSFESPRFLNDQQIIPNTPTGSGVSIPASTDEVFFHAFLPDSPKPASGYPVVIFGHGITDSSFAGPTLVASTFAQAGFAMVAINAVGHGFGPASKVVITDFAGVSTEQLTGGRGLDLNGDREIGETEGCLLPGPPPPIALRDCLRQTALDLAQLTRAIRIGVDLDGDGTIDLDPGRIYYAGQSLGAMYGTIFTAIEPAVRAAALNVGGGSVVDIARWSLAFRSWAADFLRLRMPPLLNRGDDFNENYVLRYRPLKVNQIPARSKFRTIASCSSGCRPSAIP